MAYISQELKKELSLEIKKVLKKYKMKGTVAIRDSRKLIVNVSEGSIPFNDFTEQPKPYEHWRNAGILSDRKHKTTSFMSYCSNSCNLNGQAHEFLTELYQAMNTQNYDNSDVMTDYFDVGYYTEINIGRSYDKPYKHKEL